MALLSSLIWQKNTTTKPMETKHYKLTDETKTYGGLTLYRIELTKDCKWGKSGDVGGWVEKQDNLIGDAWVSGDAMVSGNARVYGNAEVYGNARVSGGQWDTSPLQIQGSKHYFNVCDVGKIRIGCILKSIDEWERDFEQVGKKQGYTEEQIREYGLYIQLAKQLYGN